MDAGPFDTRKHRHSFDPVLTKLSKIACAAVAVTALASLLGGCTSTANSGYMELPDLATKSPSKQPTMSPAEQKKAVDELVAKRDQQAAEAAKAAK